MKNIIKTSVILLFAFVFFSCNKEDKNDIEPKKEITLSEESIARLKESTIKQKELGNGIKQVNVTDLYAQIKDNKNKEQYLKFNLEKAKWVTGDDWDIAFYSRSIVINGGRYVLSAPYNVLEPERKGNAAIAIMGKMSAEEEGKPENLVPIAEVTDGDYLKITEVPKSIKFVQDKRGRFAIDENSKGMFEYNLSPIEHVITIKKLRFLIIRTINGHYAKLKFKSLYKGGGKTATKGTNMNDAMEKYFGYYTFTYNYNRKKGDKKLQ